MGEEFGVGTLLYDMAFFEHENAVGVEDGAQAVGNQDRDAMLRRRQLPHGVGDLLFGERIQRRSGLVKHKQGRLAEEGAGNAEALFFHRQIPSPHLRQ